MWNPFLHYERSGVLSGCEWGFVLWGFDSVGFCPYTDIYCAQPLELLIHINFTQILTPTRPNNE